jgi:hypothetical protein
LQNEWGSSKTTGPCVPGVTKSKNKTRRAEQLDAGGIIEDGVVGALNDLNDEESSPAIPVKK